MATPTSQQRAARYLDLADGRRRSSSSSSESGRRVPPGCRSCPWACARPRPLLVIGPGGRGEEARLDGHPERAVLSPVAVRPALSRAQEDDGREARSLAPSLGQPAGYHPSSLAFDRPTDRTPPSRRFARTDDDDDDDDPSPPLRKMAGPPPPTTMTALSPVAPVSPWPPPAEPAVHPTQQETYGFIAAGATYVRPSVRLPARPSPSSACAEFRNPSLTRKPPPPPPQ